jgi:hypothetical protein
MAVFADLPPPGGPFLAFFRPAFKGIGPWHTVCLTEDAETKL